MDYSVQNSEKEDPKNLYKHSAQQRKLFTVIILLSVVTAELIVAGVLSTRISANDLKERVINEFVIRTLGKLEFEDGVYLGNTDFGYMTGLGEYTFNSGIVYEGEWFENSIDGQGVLEVPDKGTYKGEFTDNMKNGIGTFTWDDGTIYTGEWKNDQMWGHGEYISTDGVVYSGEFEENEFIDGKCTFENSTGSYVLTYINGKINNAIIEFPFSTTYEGDYDNTGLTGSGTMSFTDGDQYSGEYKNGKRSGEGTYTWNSGDEYEGTWVDDAMSGSGKYTFADGSYASGTFEDNSFIDGTYYTTDDFGEYTFKISDGEIIDVDMVLENGTNYSGDIQNGKLSGYAQISYSNGDKYIGSVSDGLRNGQGIYTWTSGSSYNGQWQNDEVSGVGTYYYSSLESGYKLTGTFVNGKPDGECKYYESISSDDYWLTNWSEGQCIEVFE